MSWARFLPLPVEVREMIVDKVERLRAVDAYAATLDEFQARSDGQAVFHVDKWPWRDNCHPLLCGRRAGYTMNKVLTVERMSVDYCVHAHASFHRWNGRDYRFWPFGGMNADLATDLVA